MQTRTKNLKLSAKNPNSSGLHLGDDCSIMSITHFYINNMDYEVSINN